MNEIFTQVISNIITATILGLLGLGAYQVVVIRRQENTKRGGKKMIIMAILMIIGGLAWAGSNSPQTGGFDFSRHGTIYGMTLTGYGLIILIIGKIVAWYQK